MKWIFLFRHGETDFNREHRFQGHLDIPLNDEGRAQAARLQPTILRLGLEEILSSDLCRAHETARIASADLKLPIISTPGLREAYLGDAQGLTAEELELKFGEALVSRWKSPYRSDADVSYPGGETGREVLERVLKTLREHLAITQASRIGIATHGGVIRRVVRSLIREHEAPIPIPNGIIYPLQWDPATRRLYYPGFTPLE